MSDTTTSDPPMGATSTDGDDLRFAQLFDATHARLLSYALRRAQTPSDAADIVAETYLVAWRRLAQVPPNDTALPWLYAVARRIVANHHRGQRRRLALVDRVRATLAATPPTPPPAAASHDRALEALARLEPDDQEILRLDAWEELTSPEIAQVLGITSGAARVRLHRARRRLAAAFDDLTAHEQGDERS